MSLVESRLLGIFAFLVSVVPALAIAVAISAPWLLSSHREVIFGSCLPAFIIAAGLQVPAFVLVASAAGDRVPESEKSLFRQPFRQPFGIFLFWWRYVRKPAPN